MTSYPFNLGGHSREVSTQSPEAQTWFDRGLNWCFGFHQEEGIRCFKRALDHDPTCLMAHWGIAYGCGPFYNLAWHELGVAEAAASTALATTHIAQARACYGQATTLEIELVEALSCRFQQQHLVTRAIALAEACDGAPHPRSADLLGEDVGITITQPFAATESGHEPLTSIPRKCSSNSWSEGSDPSVIGARAGNDDGGCPR